MNNNGWILIKDRLPELEKYVLVQDVIGAIYIGKRYAPDTFPDLNLFIEKYTHCVTTGFAWQPLPAPYKEKEV